MRLTRLLLILLLCSPVAAHDYAPGEAQSHPILLKGGDVYTVSGGVLTDSDLLFEDGVITQIGENLTPPEGCEVLDVTGKSVYPGLIAPATTLGLIEIGAVRATNDITEVGAITPEVKTYVAYNPDSEVIPSIRANGVSTVQVIPGGALLRGRSCILHLDGWTVEDAVVKEVDGLHLSWPAVAVRSGWYETRTPKKQKEDMARNRTRLNEAFDDARAYYLAKQNDPSIPIDLRWEAMLPVFSGELPVFVHANDYRQIEQAVRFAGEQEIRIVIVGGKEAWKLTDLLTANDIPVIYGNVHSMPMRQDDPYDITFEIPRRLQDAGLKYCIGLFSATGVRNLAFQAGQAVSFGLTREQALRAITLSTAEILGIDDQLGSLEVGKKATLIVSEGDILDYLGHNVTRMYIEGRQINLDSKQNELYRKYRERGLSK